jgi:hypothetical protein
VDSESILSVGFWFAIKSKLSMVVFFPSKGLWARILFMAGLLGDLDGTMSLSNRAETRFYHLLSVL